MNLYSYVFYFNHPKQFAKDFFYQRTNAHKLRNYLSLATTILNYKFHNIHSDNKLLQANAINKILRILALNVQDSILAHVINREFHYQFSPVFISGELDCTKCHTIQKLDLLPITPPHSLPFDISKNPAISASWNIDRLISAFGNIGNYVNCPFKFDPLNHIESVLITPINLLIIGNGFHSSTSGIYDESAIYYPDYILDISDWYEEICFNGTAFIHARCGSILNSPENKAIGIIYEIGRLLLKSNVNLLDLQTRLA